MARLGPEHHFAPRVGSQSRAIKAGMFLTALLAWLGALARNRERSFGAVLAIRNILVDLPSAQAARSILDQARRLRPRGCRIPVRCQRLPSQLHYASFASSSLSPKKDRLTKAIITSPLVHSVNLTWRDSEIGGYGVVCANHRGCVLSHSQVENDLPCLLDGLSEKDIERILEDEIDYIRATLTSYLRVTEPPRAVQALSIRASSAIFLPELNLQFRRLFVPRDNHLLSCH
jgi:hypothetical protein